MGGISDSNSSLTTRLQYELRSQMPLPVKQLLIIATISLASPLTNSIIYSVNDGLVTGADTGPRTSENDMLKPSIYPQLLV